MLSVKLTLHLYFLCGKEKEELLKVIFGNLSSIPLQTNSSLWLLINYHTGVSLVMTFTKLNGNLSSQDVLKLTAQPLSELTLREFLVVIYLIMLPFLLEL